MLASYELHVSLPILGYFCNKGILHKELGIWKDTEFQYSCLEARITKPTVMMISQKFERSELHLGNFKISVSLHRIADVQPVPDISKVNHRLL